MRNKFMRYAGAYLDLQIEKLSVSEPPIEPIELLNSGDKGGLALIYQKLFQDLFLFARGFLSKQDAEDLVEESFIRLYLQKKEFANFNEAKAYLKAIIRNLAIDKSKATLRESLIEREFANRNTEKSSGANPDYLIKEHLISLLLDHINRLPSKCREVLKLSFLEGMKTNEIAKMMGLSEHTIKNHKKRGIAKLRVKWRKRKE